MTKWFTTLCRVRNFKKKGKITKDNLFKHWKDKEDYEPFFVNCSFNTDFLNIVMKVMNLITKYLLTGCEVSKFNVYSFEEAKDKLSKCEQQFYSLTKDLRKS